MRSKKKSPKKVTAKKVTKAKPKMTVKKLVATPVKKKSLRVLELPQIAHANNLLPQGKAKNLTSRYRFVRDLLGWSFVVVFVFGVLSMLASYNGSGNRPTVSINKLTRASVISASVGDADPTVMMVGDISLARYIEEKMRGNNDFTLPFANVADYLKQTDITVGMFNNTIIPGKITANDSYILRTDPKSVQGLTFAGFDLLSVATNQVMNYKASGMIETLDSLRNANIQAIGAGKNLDEAHTPAIFEVKGKKIAFYAYVDPNILKNRDDSAKFDAPGLALMNIEDVKRDVQNALAQADFVVVMMHAGTEYKKEPSEFTRQFAHAAIDAGASAVVGTHPHIVQEVENYGDGIVFYSLGNFLFDQFFSDSVRTGLTVKFTFSGEKGTKPEFEIVPVRLDSFQPFIPEIAERDRYLKLAGF